MQNKEKKAEISCKLRKSAMIIFGAWEALMWFLICLFIILTTSTSDSGLIFVFPIFLFIFLFFSLMPIVAVLIDKRRRKLTSLTVKEKEIVGSYTAFIPIGEILLRMPIEKIDNVAAVDSIFDTYSGKRICISSTSGRIKIPFVENADEVVAFISETIEKVRSGRGAPHETISEHPQEDPIDALKKFAELRDAGIISDEEFNQKKQELLNKV